MKKISDDSLVFDRDIKTHDLEPSDILEILNNGGQLCFSGALFRDSEALVQIFLQDKKGRMFMLDSQDVKSGFCWMIDFNNQKLQETKP